jgi:hypothetical protein
MGPIDPKHHAALETILQIHDSRLMRESTLRALHFLGLTQIGAQAEVRSLLN